MTSLSAPPSWRRAAAALTDRVGLVDARRVAEITGLTREQWGVVGRAFPALGRDPGAAAARARLRLRRRVGRALGAPSADATWTGTPPAEPALLVTAHVGDLRALRYLLRRRVPAASLIAPWVDRGEFARDDEDFDRGFPCPFPHVFPSDRPHVLRGALRSGSLIVAADVPAPGAAVAQTAALCGTIRLDTRPFRLARISGVACRSAFLTAPGGVLTVTLGNPLPGNEEEALRRFGSELASVVEAAPFEIDGVTRFGQLR